MRPHENPPAAIPLQVSGPLASNPKPPEPVHPEPHQLSRGPQGEAPPATRDELRTWLATNLNLSIPSAPLLPNHSAPLDYLAFAFFDGRDRWPSTETANPTATPTPATATTTDCVVWANRGGGKTFLGAVATLLDLVFKPGIEIRILGGALEQSRRMHAHLRKLFDPRHEHLAAMVEGRITERRLRLTNGSEVELLAQSQTSVRGTRVQKLRCDEVDLFHPDVWEAAQLATRSAVRGGVLVPGSVECLSTMHVPWGMMHRLIKDTGEGRRALFRWGVVDVLEHCPPQRRCRQPGVATDDAHHPGDCPLWSECRGRAKPESAPRAPGHISIADAINLKTRVSLATWNAEMLCLRPRRTDSVYPEFDHGTHVRSDTPFEHADPPADRFFAGLDFGYRAPTAIIWAALDDRGTLWVLDERSEVGRLVEEHGAALVAGAARAARAWPRPHFVAVDPAGLAVNDQTGRSSVQILRGLGLSVRATRRDLRAGLELVRARLRPADPADPPRLYIHPRCTTLIESLEKYHYPADDPESASPVKDGADHIADALRYLVQNLAPAAPFKQTRYTG